MKINKHPFLCALALIPAANVFAAENLNDIKFEIQALSKLTDNALRQPTDLIEERQDEYIAGVSATYANDWTYLKTSYDASRHIFEHESQQSRNLLQGETELTFGNLYQPLSLLLTHSRRSLLNKSDAVDLLSNRDERDVLAAQPSVRWKINSSDALMLGANYSEVSYKFEGAKDSKIKGVNLAWQLGISKVDTVIFAIQQNEINFGGSPAFDYKNQSANARYSVELNNLSYAISVGGNRIISEASANDLTRPSFDVVVNYVTGYDSFRFIANKKITDTSMGDGNNTGLGVSPGDSLGKGLDMVDLGRTELLWTTTSLCDRCQINANAFGVSQKYQKTDQSYTEKGIGAGFNYRLTKAASVYLNGSHSDRTFEPNSKRTDFTMNRVSIGFMYKFQNDLQLKIYRFQEKRNSNVFAETYVEHYTGLSLSYSF